MRRIATLFIVVFFFFGFSQEASCEIRMKKKNAPDAFRLSEFPVPAPTAKFKDSSGKYVSIADFKGKVLLVNVWATSCPQCVVELPMLDRLQKDLGGLKFQVVALASGGETAAEVRRLFGERNISRLGVFTDEAALFSKASGVLGLPTTFLIDADGLELGRIRGMAEWDGVTIKAQIRDLIRQAKLKPPALPETPEAADNHDKTDAESDVPPPPDRTNAFSGWFKR